jgi:hypothetical protein
LCLQQKKGKHKRARQRSGRAAAATRAAGGTAQSRVGSAEMNIAADAVGDEVTIVDGPLAGESLTLHDDMYWRLTRPEEVVQRVPWALPHSPRTKHGIVAGYWHHGELVLDDSLHDKELLGPELQCVGCFPPGTPPGAECGLRAGTEHRHRITGEVLYYINAVHFHDGPDGRPLCSFCNATFRHFHGLDEDADDDDEEEDDEEEAEGVPIDVLETLPRRTILRATRHMPPCAICLSEPIAGLCLIRLPCHHEFCEPCITAWLGHKNACPSCRASI